MGEREREMESGRCAREMESGRCAREMERERGSYKNRIKKKRSLGGEKPKQREVKKRWGREAGGFVFPKNSSGEVLR